MLRFFADCGHLFNVIMWYFHDVFPSNICDLLQQNPEQVAWDYFEIYRSLKFQRQKYCQKVKFEVLVFL